MSKVSSVLTLVSVGVFAVAQSVPSGKDQALFEINRGGANAGLVGSGTILYHGGPIMGVSGSSPINTYYIWYGDWATLDGGANTILTTLANGIGGSPYFNINTTYYNSSSQNLINAVTLAGSVNDNYSQGKVLGDFGTSVSVESVVKSHVGPGSTFHDLPLDVNGVYFVLTTPDVSETSGFCSQYCGWHTYTTISSVNVKFAFIGDPLRCPGSCEFQSIGPNGSGGADGMASIIAHELEEAATDPLLNAWFFASGNENADQCAWTFGTMSTAPNGAKYNMTLGGLQFLIQQNWLNVGAGSCTLAYSPGPDFSLSPSPGTQSVGPTGNTSYTINVNSLSGFSGNVTLSISGSLPTGVTASFVGNPVAAPGGATLNITTSSAVGGSYTITIQGVSGSLNHTATVTLNVTDFTISVSPSSRSVVQGNGVPFTVTDTAAGGFSSSVNFTASGLPSGATASFSPTSVAGSGSSTMTVATTTSTPVGSYPLTVTGSTSGGLSHSGNTTLNVTAIGSFSPIRINAGGPAYTDTLGNVWAADSNYNAGGVNTTTNPISGTPDQVLYKDWRWGPNMSSPLIYTFTGIPNGNYSVTLDFVEAKSAVAGNRVFNVSINGTAVLSNFDIYGTAGLNNAYPQTFGVGTSTGKIVIQFTPVSGTLPPTVCAIAILAASPSPTLSSITPNNGAQGGSVPVTISGSNLTGATINLPPGVTASGVTLTSGSITARFNISGTASTGQQNVTVTAGGVTSNAVTFTVNPAPSLSGISPNNGAQRGSVPVTISGSNLTGATINPPPGITVSGVTVTSGSITATFGISGSAPSGQQNVTVTAGGVTSNAVTFTVNLAPSLSGITPNGGPEGGAVSVTITGSNLTGATLNPVSGITFSGVTVTASSINATFNISNTASTGAQNVTVNAGGVNSNPVTFTISPPPNLGGISPGSGAQGASVPVTITGSNLTGATLNALAGITFSGVTVTSGSISATFNISSIAATGARNVTVSIAGVNSNPVTFTVNAAFTPIRINTGGSAYTDTTGNVWSADSNYSGGGIGSTANTISGTPDQALYQNWRYAPSGRSLTYTFNGIPNGGYNVTLDFVEAATAVVGNRVFNVSINGTTVLSNFDIYQTAGFNHAYPQTFGVTTSTGQIVIQLTPTGTTYPPIISAIQIQ
jgi:hypothetical protein